VGVELGTDRVRRSVEGGLAALDRRLKDVEDPSQDGLRVGVVVGVEQLPVRVHLVLKVERARARRDVGSALERVLERPPREGLLLARPVQEGIHVVPQPRARHLALRQQI